MPAKSACAKFLVVLKIKHDVFVLFAAEIALACKRGRHRAREALLFLEKKKQKNFVRWCVGAQPSGDTFFLAWRRRHQNPRTGAISPVTQA